MRFVIPHPKAADVGGSHGLGPWAFLEGQWCHDMANGVGRFQHGDGDAPWMNHTVANFLGTKKNTQKPAGQILTNLKTSELKGSKGNSSQNCVFALPERTCA